MKDKVTQSEIEKIDNVYHALIVHTQKMNEKLWRDKLQGISTVEIWPPYKTVRRGSCVNIQRLYSRF